MEYTNTHFMPHEVMVYLSLGDREEHTKNQVMAKVGDATRQQNAVLESSPMVTRSTLEWNHGGHFTDPELRVVKGITWIMENQGDVDEELIGTNL